MTMQSTEKKSELIVVKRKSGVALVMFDAPGKNNSLGSLVIAELNNVLSVIESDSSIKAVVGISGKPDSFILGADLSEIRKTDSEDKLLLLSQQGQKVLNRISALSKPFVVAINGACLGGGLEIALSAHARLATTGEKTVLGLPEIRLGLIPGCGGTQRLPRLIGLKSALDLILNATTISAQTALEIGLVDELVEADCLIEAAEKKALILLESDAFKDLLESNRLAMEGSPDAGLWLKDLTPEKAEKLLAISERATRVRTKGQYPAPLEAIRAIRTGITQGFGAGLKAEAEAFSRLAGSELAANLIALFFSTDLARGTAQLLIRRSPGSSLKTLGIIGAGTMGSALAQLAAANGISVKLKTASEKLDAARERVRHFAQRSAHQRFGGGAENEAKCNQLIENTLARFSVVSSAAEFSDADIVIECVIEDKPVKQETLRQLSGSINDKCVVASNTSALSITQLAQSIPNPENFLGAHFFYPVDRMPLVELIMHPATSKTALARASALALAMEKTPLIVKDSPGFLVNRLLTVYLFELARIAEEGTPLNWVEEAMLEFGMPMGPLQLMDEIGIDLAFEVARKVEEGLGARMKSPAIFHRCAATGIQGKSGNAGFWLWENNERKLGINYDLFEKIGAVASSQKYEEHEKRRITDRMILTMLDEAARCLEEKVVARAREVDLGLVLGIGFPAFRGGVFKYADQRGLKNLIGTLEEIYAVSSSAGTAAERSVSSLLRKYAEEGRGFYSLSAG